MHLYPKHRTSDRQRQNVAQREVELQTLPGRPGTGETQEFTYGYVLTCHKAQGSEWDRVIVFDESRFFRADWQSWLYTACT